MRVYLPATLSVLRQLVDTGSLGPAPLTGFAVTPGLRDWYVDDDQNELEYAAMLEAARGSLRLLDAEPSAPRRRAVIAVDVPDSAVEVRDDLDRGVVVVTEPVSMAAVASAHVDDSAAEVAVAAAAAAVIAADLGDAASQDAVDDAEGHELSWFASQEIAALLELL